MTYMGWLPTEVLKEIKAAGPSRLKSMAVWYGISYAEFTGRKVGLDRGVLHTEKLRAALYKRLEGKEN